MINKSDSAARSSDFVITLIITDRIGLHSVLLPLLIIKFVKIVLIAHVIRGTVSKFECYIHVNTIAFVSAAYSMRLDVNYALYGHLLQSIELLYIDIEPAS